MITFLVSLAALITAYFVYSKVVERIFRSDDSVKTPALRIADGVDYVPLPGWKIFLIQFLNIAGLGPIFGAILGAMYGPMSYLWIVIGCIFFGAVHDYFSGMLSIRNDGSSIPELTGRYMGVFFKNFMRILTILLLVFVGVAFVNGPAGLLETLTGGGLRYWLYGIFAYYILATLLPINKIIGKIYPVFGIALLFMAVMVGGYLIFGGITGKAHLNELTLSGLKNLHDSPGQNILFPMLFIVISCGAISGFHSTQSPMMARCMTKESQGRPVFFGAMIAEGIVALIWATAAINFFGDTHGLNDTFIQHGKNPAWIVNEICQTWLGKVGAVIAILGVVACPITTGDTAFRSARLTIADMLRFKQNNISKRLIISIPIFIVGFILSQLDFSTIWKFVGISNQLLACIVLWTGASYQKQKGGIHWILTIPATIMTVICVSYFLMAPVSNGGLFLPLQIGLPAGLFVGLASFSAFFFFNRKNKILLSESVT
ncbi:MAG: carbon starvation protein A [Bacteroidales bacterium]|nr:carbon starvation protein A [Bacteroidales bacterium]